MNIFVKNIIPEVIIIYFLGVGCHGSSYIKNIDYLKTNNFYLRKIEVDSSMYYNLSNDTISNEGAYLFLGKKISPFSKPYNDESRIHLSVDSLSGYEIIFVPTNIVEKRGEIGYKLAIDTKP